MNALGSVVHSRALVSGELLMALSSAVLALMRCFSSSRLKSNNSCTLTPFQYRFALYLLCMKLYISSTSTCLICGKEVCSMQPPCASLSLAHACGASHGAWLPSSCVSSCPLSCSMQHFSNGPRKHQERTFFCLTFSMLNGLWGVP